MELIHHSLDSAQPCRFQTSGRPTIEPTFSLLVHESMGVLCEVSEIADQMVKTWMEETFGDRKITNMAGLRKCGPARSVCRGFHNGPQLAQVLAWPAVATTPLRFQLIVRNCRLSATGDKRRDKRVLNTSHGAQSCQPTVAASTDWA